MSSTWVTIWAPSRISRLAPTERGSRGEPGTGEDQPALFAGQAGGDQRARACGCLDDNDRDRKPRHKTIAPREVTGARLPAERHLAELGTAVVDDVLGEADVVGRIDAVEPTSEHGDGAGSERGFVGGSVDAARQAGSDDIAVLAKVAGKPFGDLDPRYRGVARTDDGDGRAGKDRGVAVHRDQRRSVVDMRQPCRIVSFASRDQTSAAPLEIGDFAFGRVGRIDMDRPPAASGKLGRRLDCRGGAAEMVKKLAEGCRPDAVAANKAQPGEALLGGQSETPALCAVGVHVFWPILLSVPAASRRMFPL